MTTATAFTGAVLTGGRSRRMGRDKAMVEVGGQAMGARVAAALRAAGATDVVAVGGDAAALTRIGFGRVIADEHPGEGPLGGLLTALGSISGVVVVVVACDLPALTPATIVSIVVGLGDHQVALATHGAREPLVAAWRRTACLPVLGAAFAGGERAVHRALDQLDVVEIVVADPKELCNVNQPGDLPR